MPNKVYLCYEEQIEHLINKKNISMNNDEIDNMLALLKKYNYYNVINSVKLLFITGIDADKKYTYDPKSFQEWEFQWYKMNELSYCISQEILETEKLLNTFVSHYISKEYICGTIESKLSSTYIQVLQSESKSYGYDLPINENNKLDISLLLTQSWKYTPKLTFGGLMKIFMKINSCDASLFFNQSKINNYFDLRRLKYFRNKLLHNTPLIIAMNHSSKTVRNERKRTIKKLLDTEEYSRIDEWSRKLNEYWKNRK